MNRDRRPHRQKIRHRLKSGVRRSTAPRNSYSMSDDVPIVVTTGSGAVTSHLLVSKDQVFVATNMNKIGRGIFAKSEICEAKRVGEPRWAYKRWSAVSSTRRR